MPVRCRDVSYLHPRAYPIFLKLYRTLQADYREGLTPHCFEIFETYRSPQHQTFAKSAGRSQADAFWSAHQYGLAVDFVPHSLGRGFYWDAKQSEWDHLRMRAHELGLDNSIAWDRSHVQHPLWLELRTTMLHWRAA